MNNEKFKTRPNNQIDLRLVIIKLWKEKITIILTCFLCLIVGIFLSTKLNKDVQFTAHIKITHPSQTKFLPYSKIVISSEFAAYLRENTEESYLNIFGRELNSVDNLVEFAIQNKKIELFKEYLNKKDITIKEYYSKKKFGVVYDFKNKIIPNLYRLDFPEILDGETFLNQYLIYTKNKSIMLHLKELNSIMENILTHYTYNLEIAENIGLENPLIIDPGGAKMLNERQVDFYHRGYKVLKQQIEYIENVKLQIKKENFDYNPILDESIIVNSDAKDVIIYPLLSLILGLILSFIIIYLKGIFEKK